MTERIQKLLCDLQTALLPCQAIKASSQRPRDSMAEAIYKYKPCMQPLRFLIIHWP
jgi:hypothetical protein